MQTVSRNMYREPVLRQYTRGGVFALNEGMTLLEGGVTFLSWKLTTNTSWCYNKSEN